MKTPLAEIPFGALVLALAFSELVPETASGWGQGHSAITRGALAVLPGWQRELLGAEMEPLGREHCLIPDQVYSKKTIQKFATMESRPDTVYLVNLHLPVSEEEDSETLRYFLGKAVERFAAGNPAEGARFTGTVAHLLEDWGCPAHSVPGDNMFTLFKHFLPPPPEFQYTALHGPMESGEFQVDIGSYRPQLLGASVDEAAFRLLQRVRESTIYARGQVIPILQALYAKDTEGAAAAQQKAGEVNARVVADAVCTILSLAAGKCDPEAVRALETLDLSERYPREAPDLVLPQAAFFSRPYWGHALRGVALREGKEPVALKLRMDEGGTAAERVFDRALGVGTKSTLTYTVPAGVFSRFETWAGLHAELGREGKVTFEVRDQSGKLVATSGPLDGAAPARRLVVPLRGVTALQLTAVSAGGDGHGNYAVWAEPKLVK